MRKLYVKYLPNYSVDLNTCVLHDCSCKKELITTKKLFFGKSFTERKRKVDKLAGQSAMDNNMLNILFQLWSYTISLIHIYVFNSVIGCVEIHLKSIHFFQTNIRFMIFKYVSERAFYEMLQG